jgi:glycine betaine/proline transport system substrate-binding protein
VPDYVPADQVAALPDLVRPEVTDRMAILVVQGTTPGAGLTMRTQELVREYGLTRSAGATGSGTWQIISTVNARITARDWFVTRSGSPQHLNEVHQLRPLDDPLGVIPPPDQAWLTANPPRSSGCPRARAVLQRVRFTLADATAMDYAVNVDGLDPLSAARWFMDERSDDVRRWFG